MFVLMNAKCFIRKHLILPLQMSLKFSNSYLVQSSNTSMSLKYLEKRKTDNENDFQKSQNFIHISYLAQRVSHCFLPDFSILDLGILFFFPLVSH